MKIYYSSSLWSKERGVSGLQQKVCWQFEYAGAKRCIPVVYHFPEGIVFDIITFLDAERLREFFEKYEAIEEKMTPSQRRCAEQEHPYQSVPIKEIWINEKQTKRGYSSSGTISIPWARQNDDLALVRKVYSSILRDTDCFACERFRVPYPETGSKVQKFLRSLRLGRVKSLKLFTHPVQYFSPLDMHFEISSGENQKEIQFKHPDTGVIHTLYFQNTEPVELPFGTDKSRILHTVQAMYEVEPALQPGDTLQFNSGIQYTEPPEDGFSPASASSIGIIGGADGPTAIFVAGKDSGKEKAVPCGLHGLPLHSCFSVPGFQREDTCRFVLEGINMRHCDGREYELG